MTAKSMQNIKPVLKKFLENSTRIVFLAIGSELRGDDAAGLVCANELLKNNPPDNFKVLLGHTAPENLTGEIKRFNPTHLIICDAADSGLEAGQIGVIEVERVDGAAFSTHMMPMNVFINYISQGSDLKTLILGLQPENLEFGAEVTQKVQNSAVELAGMITEALKVDK